MQAHAMVNREQSMKDAEQAYSLDASQAAASGILDQYVARSHAVRIRFGAHLGLEYGGRPDERIDVFTPSRNGAAPFVAFFHGGWWKANNRITRAFLAEHFLSRGFGFASIGYPLAPEYSIATICESALNALSWLRRNGSVYGLNPSRIVLAGNSAGGHLAAMAGSDDALAAARIPPDAIAGIVALSGLYDLGPLVGTFVERWLPLDAASISTCSPILHLPARGTPILLAVGEAEPEGFKTQMRTYAETLKRNGRSVITEECAGHSHFSIIGQLGQPGAQFFDFSVSHF